MIGREFGMENEHQGYAFSKALLRERRLADIKDVTLGMCLVVIGGGLGYWLSGVGTAIVVSVCCVALASVLGFFDSINGGILK